MGDGILSRFSKTWLKKLEAFKYPALVLLIGLVLVLVPGRKPAEPEQPDIQTKTPEPASDEALAYLAQTEQRLASILSRINGAGQVDVMLTLRSGKAHQYQSDYRTETDHHETGDHEHVAVGKVQHFGDAVDHRVAERDDGVHAAEAQTADQIR